MTRPMLVLCLSLALLTLTACAGAVIGGAAGTGYSRGKAQLLADARLEARIQSILLNDAVTGQYDITVVARDGVVVLRGTVPGHFVSSRAVSLVRQVEGVSELQSALRVRR